MTDPSTPDTAASDRGEEPRNMDKALGDGGMPLLAQLGLDFDAYGVGYVEAAWIPTKLACNPAGIVHGGVYGVIHDATMNFATNSALARGDRGATIDVQYQTIRSSKAGDRLRVKGRVVRLTTHIAYLETIVTDAEGELISRATGTFMVRRRGG
jgi:uncharacterized protein (TIGR00369 family)